VKATADIRSEDLERLRHQKDLTSVAEAYRAMAKRPEKQIVGK
jgi:hypothetical protein